MRISDKRAQAIRDYKHGSENDPGTEARQLAAALLDSRALCDKLAAALRDTLPFAEDRHDSAADLKEWRAALAEYDKKRGTP